MSNSIATVRLTRSRIATSAAVTILAIHALLLGWVSFVSSPNLEEPANLASGISHWTFGRFDLYRVNPPLVRMVAALPIMTTTATTDWSDSWSTSPYSRAEFHAGARFLRHNAESGFWYFTLARWACIPLCLVGLWTVFAWARALYGSTSGLTAMILYGFSPDCIAWGASITPDAAGASLGLLAAYLFWRWLGNPTEGRTALAGLGLGLAALASGTLIILFALWPCVWLLHRWPRPTPPSGPPIPAELAAAPMNHEQSDGTGTPTPGRLATVMIIALYLLNLGYGFKGSFTPLKDYPFVSRTFSGQERPPAGANRFAESWLGVLPVPFPADYVRGLDLQRFEFESGLCLDFRSGQDPERWRYQDLSHHEEKAPPAGFALLVLVTLLAIVNRRYRSGWRDESALLLPAVAILLVIGSQTDLTRDPRYALPALPFACIHLSRAAIALARRPGTMAALLSPAAHGP